MTEIGAASAVQWVPVKTASRVLGISKQRVYEVCRQNKLQSMEVDGVRLVSLRSIAGYDVQRKAGRGRRNANR